MLRTFILILVCSLVACGKPTASLAPVQQSHELVVATFNSPTTYYIDGNENFAGFEYDLAKLFAKSLGQDVKVKFLIVANAKEAISAVTSGHAHLAAAGIGMERFKDAGVRFSPSYQLIQPEIIVNRESAPQIESMADLAGKRVEIPADGHQSKYFKQLHESLPELHLTEIAQTGSEELLERVAESASDATIADSHLVGMVQNYYPNLWVALDLGEPEPLAWAFPNADNADNNRLVQQSITFFNQIKKDGTLHNLLDRYYGHSERLNATDVTHFLIQLRTVLPKYIALFKQAEETYGIDWRLLAALSYQESHWDNFSTSPTNVRGLMMLTADTADRLGVSDRLDPKQSIPAGARYVLQLKDAIPAHIAEPDRTWLALAAYNIGIAHLEDARVLAQRLKRDPDRWADIKTTLPLLNRAEYFSKLKFGFARGGAPVVFVESVRTYYKILEKYEQKFTPVLPGFGVANIENHAQPTP